jgi:NAD(P)H dehydrogenase (quinone)
MSKVLVVVGHPQCNSFCEALGRAYAHGAEEAGHKVQLCVLSQMAFDPILHEGYRQVQPLEPDLKKTYQALLGCDHLVMIFPLWCGDMPALLKGFIERILQPDLIKQRSTEHAMNWRLFRNKSARIVMTMGMPVSIYRWFYRGHALKLLRRNILKFIGINPVRHTLYGMIEATSLEKRQGWLGEMRSLGRRAA